jgi:LPXTG-site transpeptidase (sortase) family protein
LRDLFVFVILFLLGLAVWTTGLFPAAPAVSPGQAQSELLTGTDEEPEPWPGPAAGLEPAPASNATELPAREEPRDDQTAHPLRIRQLNDGPDASLLPAGNSPETSARTSKAIWRVMIPALKVDARVIDVPFDGLTWDISSLGEDIAQLGEVPGESAGENIVLAGHFSTGLNVVGPFRYISRLAVGEPVQVFTDRMVYTYRVREHAVVEEDDDRVIAATSDPQLTLLTCETWDEKTGKFLRRRVVVADLVKSEPLGNPIIQ